MHRRITRCPVGKVVDHKNGNKLDNTRENLRICIVGQNQMNRGKQSNNTSGFTGVHFVTRDRKWAAAINKEGIKYSLGSFTCPLEAAKAYKRASIDLHGDFAFQNEVPNEL